MYRILIGSLAVLLFMTAGHPASAQEAGSAFYDEGIFAYEDGKYKVAEAAFSKVLAGDPNNPSANHYQGKTYIKMERFVEAKPFIETAWKGDPGLPDLAFDRAYLYYKMADYGRATGLFQDVLKQEPSRIMAGFYCGVSLFHNQQYQEANSYFLMAAENSPDLKIKAYYYSGLCFFYMGQDAPAADKMTYVKTNAESKEVRDNADRWIEKIQAGGKERKPYRLQAKLAYEYDDNVPLEPTDQDDLYSDEKDSSILGYVEGEYDFVNQDAVILGAGISRFQSWHMDLDAYDASDTAIEIYGQYLTGLFTYGLQIRPSIYQLDGKDFLFTTQVRPEVSYTYNQQLSLWLSYTFSKNDYRKKAYDDRDSDNHEVFLDTVYLLGDDKGYALGGIGYEYNDASEDPYDYGRFTLRAGGSLNLAYALRLGVLANYAGKTYKDDDAIQDKKREDTRYKITVSLSRELYYEWLEIAAEASYTKNDSNIDDYEYTRKVVGIGLSAAY